MLRLALRSARAHWRRFVLTTVAIVVGVTFVVGSYVLTDSLAASIDRVLTDTVNRTDLVVRSAEGGGGLRRAGGLASVLTGQSAGVPSRDLAVVEAIEGVEAADVSITGAAALFDKAGKEDRFDFSFISNWPAHPEMSALTLVEGNAPVGRRDVVIDTATARDRGLRIGDEVRIGTQRGVVEARISGLAQRAGGSLGAAGTIIAFSTARATELVGTPGRVDGISVRIAPGADKDVVRARVQRAVGTDLSVVDAAALLNDARQRVQSRLSTFTGLLLGFATVTLFVSAFLIWNTFSIVVAQRTRELALLRAIGASGRQVARSVIGEGLLVGAVATAVGIGTGVLFAKGLQRLIGTSGVELPSGVLLVEWRTLVVAAAVGLGVTLISVVGPARRVARIPPLAALRSATVPPPPRSRRTALAAIVALFVGLVAGAWAFVGAASGSSAEAIFDRVRWIGIGAAFVALGLIILTRYLIRPVIGAIGGGFARLGQVAARIAPRNATRNPRRTAATASALMIGIALVGATLVLGSSIKTAYGGGLRSSIKAPVILEAEGIVPLSPAVLAAVRAVDGVTGVVPVAESRVEYAIPSDENRIEVSIGDPRRIATVLDAGYVHGSAPTNGREIAIAERIASKSNIRVGDPFTVRSGGIGRTLRVSGIYLRDEVLGDVLVRPGALRGLPGVDPSTQLAFVGTNSRDELVNQGIAREVGVAAAAIPNSSAKTAGRFVDDKTGALDLLLEIVNVLLFFAVLVAAMGITNTLALSIVERTREVGLLRAVGMLRRDVKRMVRLEGLLVALFGGVLGVGLGLAFGVALTMTLPLDAAQLTVPADQLVVLFVISGLLGIIAGAIPARRAARLDVLAAIAEE